MAKANVGAVDAVMFFVHNVERYEFEDLWLPGRSPHYVSEKWNLMHTALPRFWGTLDPANKERFINMVLDYRFKKRLQSCG